MTDYLEIAKTIVDQAEGKTVNGVGDAANLATAAALIALVERLDALTSNISESWQSEIIPAIRVDVYNSEG